MIRRAKRLIAAIIGQLIFMAFSVGAWTDVTLPNTFVDSGIIYASDHNENDSTLAAGINDLLDTTDQYFVRFTDFSSGDSTLLRLQVDTIRSNPDIDSIQGKPWIDSVNTASIEINNIEDLDTVRGYPFFDSLDAGYINADTVNAPLLFTDSIKGLVYADSLQGMNYIRGNPDIDSISGSPEINAATITGNLTISNTTASRLLSTNGSKVAASVTDFTSWVAGTANRVTVADDGDGTITLSSPQDLATSSAPTFATVNTGQGANELYDMDQNVLTSSTVEFAKVTIDGDHDTLLFDVEHSSGKTGLIRFEMSGASGVTDIGNIEYHDLGKLRFSYPSLTIPTFQFDLRDGGSLSTYLTIDSVATQPDSLAVTKGMSATTVNTGQGDNELYSMDQNVTTTSDVDFDSVTVRKIVVDTLAFSPDQTANIGIPHVQIDTLVSNIHNADSINVLAHMDVDSVDANEVSLTTLYIDGNKILNVYVNGSTDSLIFTMDGSAEFAIPAR